MSTKAVCCRLSSYAVHGIWGTVNAGELACRRSAGQDFDVYESTAHPTPCTCVYNSPTTPRCMCRIPTWLYRRGYRIWSDSSCLSLEGPLLRRGYILARLAEWSPVCSPAVRFQIRSRQAWTRHHRRQRLQFGSFILRIIVLAGRIAFFLAVSTKLNSIAKAYMLRTTARQRPSDSNSLRCAPRRRVVDVVVWKPHHLGDGQGRWRVGVTVRKKHYSIQNRKYQHPRIRYFLVR